MEEISAGHLHRVESFHPLHYRSYNYEDLPADQIQFVDKELDGPSLADPIQVGGGGQWKDFSDHPLFPDLVGPLPSDIRQGQVGDCYFGVGLSGIARENPDRIKQSVVDLGDGTYAVEFHTDSGVDFYRVDGDLPVDGSGKLKYLETGKDGAIWVAILEKAFAFARPEGNDSYKGLNDGSPDEAYDIMGCQNSLQVLRSGFNSATDLITWIGKTREFGMPVSIGTWDSLNGDAGPMVNDHAYDVVKVNKDANGNYVSIELRNPWGKDGKNDGSNPNDGYVTITKSQLWAATEAIWTAKA
jgi:hypothetical protein